jgi:hypothetical protein
VSLINASLHSGKLWDSRQQGGTLLHHGICGAKGSFWGPSYHCVWRSNLKKSSALDLNEIQSIALDLDLVIAPAPNTDVCERCGCLRERDTAFFAHTGSQTLVSKLNS